MYNPSDPTTDSAASTPSPGGRNARYAYLVGRLRNRQITMEEATELFNLMQASLSRSEAGRLAALAQASAAASTSTSTLPPPPPPPVAAGGSSDDFLILGLLTMGAGAGLLAAMTRKLQEPNAPATASPKSAAPK